ncbi:hypothetical protein [Pseudoalteromonas aurantia]|uniref:DUF2946 domain-containing protein n=1 Tax=Pseudoalteromonas aurantia TaxID=43654 RepID=A0A5S3VC28_9GAMM|nr:hypothetical protein [Pseudoalteromonas aurantia]TMO69626.1 hypothetical protein CWC19_04025 [Pseudoalteromonas aurantia]TMO75784.1 hypothetical protein CWC20_07425 [Pseudoalteromonas aurantia]
MQKSFFLIIILLCQPLLDSFDVENNNDAFHLTTHLLSAAQTLEAHCTASNDHERHTLQHDNLSSQLSEAADEADCHVCHISHILWLEILTFNIGFQSVLNYQSTTAFINEQHTVLLRPPIA